MSLSEEKMLEIEASISKGVVLTLILRKAFAEVSVDIVVGLLSQLDQVAQLTGCNLDRLYTTAKKELFDSLDSSDTLDAETKERAKKEIGGMIDRMRPVKREETRIQMQKFKDASDKFDAAVAHMKTTKSG